ncbi:hypothetical protein COV11_04135 [Candidatus Woesearchaeota archaeon CG10_big_fil_rev_8_21_14_0_10_30_7]|nr:MAG: hypothetical protein COV11_04135 [Candidatus Woesearchaeota archaeon CG10_big_fil_rev_8_21_14_0_10_30_7]
MVNAQYECEYDGDCSGGTCIIEQERSYCKIQLPECSDGIIGMNEDGKPVCVHSSEIPRTVCGDNVCEGPESDDWCPEDCLFVQQGGAGAGGGAGGGAGAGPGGAGGGAGGGGIAGCGNGILEAGESCENGIPCAGAPKVLCDLTNCQCVSSKCGDNKIDWNQGEICDPPGSIYYNPNLHYVEEICSKDCSSSQDSFCGDNTCDWLELASKSCPQDCGTVTCTETDHNPKELWEKGTVTVQTKNNYYMFEDECESRWTLINLNEQTCSDLFRGDLFIEFDSHSQFWYTKYKILHSFFRFMTPFPSYPQSLAFTFHMNCPDGCSDGACNGPLRCEDSTKENTCNRGNEPKFCNPTTLKIEDDCSNCGCSYDSFCIDNANDATLKNTPINSCKQICDGVGTPDQCLNDKPSYCDPKSYDIVQNCQKCGCPADFTCESNGECVKKEQLTCYECATGNFDIIGRRIFSGEHIFGKSACKKLGPGWRSTKQWIGKVSKWLGSDLKGLTGDWLKKNVKDRTVAKVLNYVLEPVRRFLQFIGMFASGLVQMFFAVCYETVDVGGQHPGFTCVSGDEMQEAVDFFNYKSKTDLLKLKDLKITNSYSCPVTKLKSSEQCKELEFNGDSSEKLDVVFISDLDDKDEILKISEYEVKDFKLTEPFKSNINKFNFWWMKYPGDTIGFTNDKLKLKAFAEIRGFAKRNCPQLDELIIISKHDFRAYAIPGGASIVPSSVFGTQYVLLHEFGHSFGRLLDEYIEEDSKEKGLFHINKAVNCARNEVSARQKWGYLLGLGQGDLEVGFFQGCALTSKYIRPTPNSIMNNNYVAEGFGAVNERELQKRLDKYK